MTLSQIWTKDFPDLGRSAQAFWIDDKLFEASYKAKTGLGMDIHRMFLSKIPIGQIIRHIQGLGNDDKAILSDDIGDELVRGILDI